MTNEFKCQRGLKRYMRKSGEECPLYIAYNEGSALGYGGQHGLPPRLHKNPYPAGRRHDEWDRGFMSA